MIVTGYNRFCGDDAEDSPDVLVLTLTDLRAVGAKLDKLKYKAEGYRFDLCLMPKQYKNNYLDTELGKYLRGTFYIGGMLRTKFIYYE